MKRTMLVVILAAAVACTAPRGRSPCEHLFGAIFEFIVTPDRKLSHFRLNDIVDCKGNPAAVTIAPAWLKTACVMLVLDGVRPTYRPGEAPKPKYTYYVYDADRPDAVFRTSRSGTTSDDPVIYVRDEILSESGSSADGTTTCNGNLGEPAA